MKAAGYSDAAVDSVITVTSIMQEYPDASQKYDQKWFRTLPKETQSKLVSYGLKYQLPQDLQQNTKRYEGEYKTDTFWRTIGDANGGFSYNGNATYTYIDNPDKKDVNTRIYHGWFSYYGNPNSQIRDARGEFDMDRQVGRWQCIFRNYDGYCWVIVNFNEKGEIEGDFTIYMGNKLPNSNIDPVGMKLVYSGSVKNHYITNLNFEGERFNRAIKIINGRYGSGNGHPAYQWNIKILDEDDPHKGVYHNLGHLKKGVYSIQYVKKEREDRENWGEDDNWGTWRDYGKCFYVEQSTGTRKDAGRDIADIPLRLSNEVRGLLNVVVMRDSNGVKAYSEY